MPPFDLAWEKYIYIYCGGVKFMQIMIYQVVLARMSFWIILHGELQPTFLSGSFCLLFIRIYPEPGGATREIICWHQVAEGIRRRTRRTATPDACKWFPDSHHPARSDFCLLCTCVCSNHSTVTHLSTFHDNTRFGHGSFAWVPTWLDKIKLHTWCLGSENQTCFVCIFALYFSN